MTDLEQLLAHVVMKLAMLQAQQDVILDLQLQFLIAVRPEEAKQIEREVRRKLDAAHRQFFEENLRQMQFRPSAPPGPEPGDFPPRDSTGA